MVVAKNCVIRLNGHNNITLVELKKVIEAEVYPNLYKLLKVALTLPVSSASCERSLSAMKRIKNWLRNSMSQEKFTNLSIIHIERQFSNNLCIEDVLNDFAKCNHRISL